MPPGVEDFVSSSVAERIPGYGTSNSVSQVCQISLDARSLLCQGSEIGGSSNSGPSTHCLHGPVNPALIELQQLGWDLGHTFGDGQNGIVEMVCWEGTVGEASANSFIRSHGRAG